MDLNKALVESIGITPSTFAPGAVTALDSLARVEDLLQIDGNSGRTEAWLLAAMERWHCTEAELAQEMQLLSKARQVVSQIFLTKRDLERELAVNSAPQESYTALKSEFQSLETKLATLKPEWEIDPDLEHETLEQLAVECERAERELLELEEKTSLCKDLPANAELARSKLEEAQAELFALEEDWSQKYWSNPRFQKHIQMSIFEVREWWAAEAGREEEFDVRSMTFLPEEFLVLGSIQGVLRVYKPRQGTFKVEDMLHEVRMDPILQVEAGNFSPTAKTVAVLHPRKLSFYARNAFNFAFGPFGSPSGQGRDFVCIQSSDGALGFYEYDTYSFAVQLPGFLVPGPITYSPVNDYFLICNSSMEVECYRYGRLRDAYNRYQQGQEATFSAEWKTNIGEYAQDLKSYVGADPGTGGALVLGEHSVFTVDSNGLLQSQKKLDYTPSCFVSYITRTDRMVLVGSFTQHLLLYKGNVLTWAAKLPHIPIAIKVVDLTTQGLIVTLSESGHVDVLYLGTTIPPYQMVTPTKALDYSEMDRDYKRILTQLNSTAEVVQRQEPADKLAISVVVPSHPGRDFQYIEDYVADDQGAIVTTVRVLLKYTGGKAEQVRVLAQCPANLSCVDSPVVLDSVSGLTPLQFQMNFAAKPGIPPVGLDITLTASYEVLANERRDLRVVKAKFRLPLLQVANPAPPSQQADFKITVGSVGQSPSMAELFPEFDLSGGNALSFTYFDGSSITIIAGKSGDRFRIQGTHFHALFIGTEELVRRLLTAGVSATYEEALPLQDVFTLIDEHYNLRKAIKDSEVSLAELTQQYIVVQKRLLVRFKDKNPAPLNNLDFLLQILNQKILGLAEEVETNKTGELQCAHRLSAAISLTHLLVKARFQLDDNNTQAFLMHLTAQVQDSEPGWEEIVNAAMTQLLRTTLAKNSKESSASIASLAFPQSTAKLKKHITIVCDRIAKGGRLAQ